MKKILVPYDFSESSKAALDYAMGMAGLFSSELLLLAVNHYPVMTPEVGLSAFTFQNAKEESLAELEKIATALKSSGSIQSITCYSEIGELGEEINKLAGMSAVDLIVMGISGHGNKFLKTFAGSSAVNVARKTIIPVIIVPPGAIFKKPARVAFACKYGDDISNPEIIEEVKKITGNLGADLHIIHVVPENHPVNHTEVVIDNYEAHKMKESVHRTFIMTEKNVYEGLLSVLNSDLVDMIILEPKKHSFFESLFHHSVTSEIAFNSPVPVMCIHHQ